MWLWNALEWLTELWINIIKWVLGVYAFIMLAGFTLYCIYIIFAIFFLLPLASYQEQQRLKEQPVVEVEKPRWQAKIGNKVIWEQKVK